MYFQILFIYDSVPLRDLSDSKVRLWVEFQLLRLFKFQLFCVLNKQWPLAPNLPKWRITRANVSRRVTFWRMSANVSSVKCIESGEKGWRMSGECSESGLSRVANLANLANF